MRPRPRSRIGCQARSGQQTDWPEEGHEQVVARDQPLLGSRATTGKDQTKNTVIKKIVSMLRKEQQPSVGSAARTAT